MNVLKAATTYGIPKSSLYDYVNGRTGARLRLIRHLPQVSQDAITITQVNEAIGLAFPYLYMKNEAGASGDGASRPNTYPLPP